MRNTGKDSDKRKSTVNFMVLVVGLSICTFCSDEENHGGHGRKVPIAAAQHSAGKRCFTAITRVRDLERVCVWRCPCAEAPVEGAAISEWEQKEEEKEGGARGG